MHSPVFWRCSQANQSSHGYVWGHPGGVTVARMARYWSLATALQVHLAYQLRRGFYSAILNITTPCDATVAEYSAPVNTTS